MKLPKHSLDVAIRTRRRKKRVTKYQLERMKEQNEVQKKTKLISSWKPIKL